jgi:hypothetical protein
MGKYRWLSLICLPIGLVAWMCMYKKKKATFDLEKTVPTKKTFTLLPFTKTFNSDRKA